MKRYNKVITFMYTSLVIVNSFHLIPLYNLIRVLHMSCLKAFQVQRHTINLWTDVTFFH